MRLCWEWYCLLVLLLQHMPQVDMEAVVTVVVATELRVEPVVATVDMDTAVEVIPEDV